MKGAETNERQYMTIRQAARVLGINPDRIRQWQKQGLVAGFYSGSRYYVNLPVFRAALEAGQIGALPQVKNQDKSGQKYCDGSDGKCAFMWEAIYIDVESVKDLLCLQMRDVGRIFKALLNWSATGERPEFSDPAITDLCLRIIDRSNELHHLESE